LSSWVAGEKSTHQFAWLSLDEGDNDKTRFMTYLISAVQQIDNALGAEAINALDSGTRVEIEAILTSLINDIAKRTIKIAIVLDDYHLIESREIDQALQYLIDHLPQNLHVVISSRLDPSLPLAKWRANGDICEIRANDLRFTLEEAAVYLSESMDLGLSSEDMAALENRTEGWIVGLKLAALSMQSLQEVEDRHEFVANFTGSNRFIQDYLTDEVLKHQPEKLREFLVLTSVLEQFNSGLCNQITGISNSQEILLQLDVANVFLIPLDEDRHWFRYHHLFSELLQSRLAIKNPEKFEEVQRKAASWFERNGYIEQAIDHALKMKEKSLAAGLIEKYAQGYLFRSRVQTIVRWMNELPTRMIEDNPYLGIYLSWALVLVKPKDYAPRIEKILKHIKLRVDECPLEKYDKDLLLGHAASIRALLNQPPVKLQHDARDVLAYLNQAQGLLPESEKEIRGMNYVNIGYEHLHLGDARSALEVNQTAYQESLVTGNYLVKAVSICSQALVRYYRGELSEARDICQRELTAVERETNTEIQSYPILGAILITDGHLSVETGEFETAIEKLLRGIELLQRIGEYEILSLGHIALTRAYLYSGEVKLANEVADSLETKWPVCAPIAQSLRIMIELFKLNQSEIDWGLVNAWLDDYSLDSLDLSAIPGITPWAETQHLTQVVSIMAFLRRNSSEGDLDSAVLGKLEKFITGRIKIARSREFLIRELECQFLLSVLQHSRGKANQAKEIGFDAISLARKINFSRWFYIVPSYILEQLADFPGSSLDRDLIENLESLLSKISSKSSDEKKLLTDREVQILECIAEGLSNKEIGARLHLALDTIKGHNRRIFRKLGVSNRAQAVKKAIALKIIS
jgi:LuxR family maltose regulon positive regulatory protein